MKRTLPTGQVLPVFRHFPLDFHPNALPAAKATYCAGQQDPKFFWGMHDWLFANQAAWSEAATPPISSASRRLSWASMAPSTTPV